MPERSGVALDLAAVYFSAVWLGASLRLAVLGDASGAGGPNGSDRHAIQTPGSLGVAGRRGTAYLHLRPRRLL
jgi:hypothetical protein